MEKIPRGLKYSGGGGGGGEQNRVTAAKKKEREKEAKIKFGYKKELNVQVRSGEPPLYRVINKPLLSQNIDTDRLRGPEQARPSSAGTKTWTTGSGLVSCDGLRVAAMYSIPGKGAMLIKTHQAF